MAGFKATRYTVPHKIPTATLATSNPPPLPPPQNIVGSEMIVSQHPDLVRASQLARFIQLALIETLDPPPVTQPDDLLGLHTLKVNLKCKVLTKFI